MSKPILCLDFDGVIHSYTSGWKGAATIPDPMVAGALHFIWDAQKYFTVAVYSSRSGQLGGIAAMQEYLRKHAANSFDEGPWCDDPHLGFLNQIEWPTEKPPAMISLDDRALTFTGSWPNINKLRDFKPWNKKPRIEKRCQNCLFSVEEVIGVIEVPFSNGEFMDRTRSVCRRMPPQIGFFGGASYPVVTEPCGEWKDQHNDQ